MTNQQKLKQDLIECPSGTIAFTTGAHIIPQKLANGKWAWVVSSFEEETFYDGESVEVNESWTDNREELAGEETGDE